MAFTACSLRYLEILKDWVESGRLDDDFGELFIQRTDFGRMKVDELRIDWDLDFTLRVWPNSLGEEIKLEPLIFRGLSQTVLNTGKSTKLAIYLKSHPINDQVSQQPYQIPMLMSCFIQEVETTIREYGPHPSLPEVHLPVPISSIYKRPTFNQTLEAKTKSTQPIFSSKQVPLPNILSQNLLASLICTRGPVPLGPQPHTLTRASSTILTPLGKLDNHTLTEQLLKKTVAHMLLVKSEGDCVAFVFHKAIKSCVRQSIHKISLSSYSYLGVLLNASFDIKHLMETVWSVFFLDRIHLAYESFQHVLQKVDVEGVNESKEALKLFVKELAGKLSPDCGGEIYYYQEISVRREEGKNISAHKNKYFYKVRTTLPSEDYLH